MINENASWNEEDLGERPAWLPGNMKWPLDVPRYAEDHPAMLDDESKNAFNEEWAKKCFGFRYFQRLKHIHKNFCGDWWLVGIFTLINDYFRRLERIGDLRKHEAVIYELNFFLENEILFVHLEGSKLRGMYLQGISLEGAHLEFCDLRYCRLQNADISNSHLNNANLQFAKLEKSFLHKSDLREAILDYANLKYAGMNNAILTNCSLILTDFSGARLKQSDFKGAILKEANFSEADIRKAKNIIFDENKVYRTHIEGPARDPWTSLRRKYTGPWFFIHLLLLIVFVFPIVSRIGFLSTMAEIQHMAIDMQNQIHDRSVNDSDFLYHDVQRSIVIKDGYEMADSFLEKLSTYFKKNGKTVPAWWILLGGHHGWLYFLLTLAIIIYNILRGVLTVKVSQLREAEERAQVTPCIEYYYGGWNYFIIKKPMSIVKALRLYQLHQIARFVFVFSIGSFIWHMVTWIALTKVWLPI